MAGYVDSRIYRQQAPEGAAYPLVVCSILSDRLILGVGGVRLGSRAEFLIRGIVDDEDQEALARIAHRIDAALFSDGDLADVSFAGETYRIRSVCLEDFEDTGTEQGVRFDSLGGQFRLFIYTTSS